MAANVDPPAGDIVTGTLTLILASTSPRRSQLLGLGGWGFTILAADVDETPHPGESPPDYVLRLAEAKARAVASQADANALIVAADTTVADEEQILGKPGDAAEAAAMLASLRGRTHQVFTAIAVFQPGSGRIETDLASTDVPMREYTNDEIKSYVASGDPFDKAGSYAIQHPEFRPVTDLSGCYANVVGLPLCHLERTLVKFDRTPQVDLPHACQRELDYECDVYDRIRTRRVVRKGAP